MKKKKKMQRKPKMSGIVSKTNLGAHKASETTPIFDLLLWYHMFNNVTFHT